MEVLEVRVTLVLSQVRPSYILVVEEVRLMLQARVEPVVQGVGVAEEQEQLSQLKVPMVSEAAVVRQIQ